jgi:hypothetical protein
MGLGLRSAIRMEDSNQLYKLEYFECEICMLFDTT